MRLIGEHIVKSRSAMSEEEQAIKEKEGIFDMAAEEAEIAAMMEQLHGPAQPTAAQQKIGPTKADKKLNKRRR